MTWERLPFDKALEYFRGKQIIPTDAWDDFLSAYQDVAFTIAGVTQAGLLQDIYDLIERSLQDGTSFEEFKKGFQQAASNTGWTGATSWRAALVYSQNLRTAYSAGRYQQLDDPDVMKARPYRIYRHRDSRVPRPLHLKWDGLVLPADDPWWDQHPCPGGFGCRCGVFSVGDRDLKAMGKTGPDPTPDDGDYTYTDKQGKKTTIPNGIDPGFNHKPGSTPQQMRGRLLKQGLSRLSPALRALVKNANSSST